MISLITISWWNTKVFAAPGVGALGNSSGPLPSGDRPRNWALIVTASSTACCPGTYKNTGSLSAIAVKPSVAAESERKPPGARLCAGSV
jgi:hypothetical protein